MTCRMSSRWIVLLAVVLANIPQLPAQQENEVAEIVVETAAGAPDVLLEEAADGLHAVPEEYRGAYLVERPSSFLIDPQRLLAPADFRERRGFLDYHAGDSAIDLYVYLFAGDQRLPDGLRIHERAGSLSADGRPMAVVCYYLGAPDRAILELSPELAGLVPGAEQRRALESAALQAAKEVEPARQLEAFLVQMSIRLYWMEGLLGQGDAAVLRTQPARPLAKPAPKPSRLMQLAGPWLDLARPYFIPASGMAGGLLVALALGWWLRHRARYHFPDFEVEPRLGGSHGAGVGAVISFANPSVPPDSQRDQMPDYLRRA